MTAWMAAVTSTALTLGGGAGAQLLETPQTTAAQPILKGFQARGTVLTRGPSTLTLDLAGGRVVGLLVQGVSVQDVARGLAAAWGGEEKNVASLAAQLGSEDVRAQARRAGGLQQDDDGTVLRLRLSGTGKSERWTAYTALMVYPDSAFPAPANAQGSAKAPNVLRIFSDFECPYCKRMWDTAHVGWAAQPNVYRVVHYHFPLEQHPNAQPAAVASECAAAQGKFWSYADRLFASEGWLRQPPSSVNGTFVDYAQALKLDVPAFQKCLMSEAPRRAVRAQYEAGLKVNVQGTPSVYLNGVQMQDYSDAQEMALIRTVTAASPGAAQVIGARLKTLR